MILVHKTLLILLITLITSCSTTKYEKSSRFNYYGYKDKLLSDNTYEINYKVNYKTPLKQCVDFAIIRASQIALENSKNLALKELEAYRSYEKNPRKLPTGIFIHSAALGEKYAMDRVGNVVLEIELSEKGISACSLCTVIRKEYGDNFFEKDFCNCTANKNNLIKSKDILEKKYSAFNKHHLNRAYGNFNVLSDVDKALNPHKYNLN